MAGPYTQNQAADIFRQFGDGDPGYTLYYPDGTPADPLNKQTNATAQSRLDYWSTHPDEAAAWNAQVARENAAWQASHIAPSASWLDDLVNLQLPTITLPKWPSWPALPWGWIGLAVGVVIVLPITIRALEAPEPPQRRVSGDTPRGERRRRRRRRQ